MLVDIRNTLNVVCKHVTVAEESVRRSVRESFPSAEEEQITTLFQEKLHESLSAASQNGDIVRAFTSDLYAAGVPPHSHEAFQMARGIIAEVSWHSRHVEAKSGGDFGLLFARPKLEKTPTAISIRDGQVTALLAQAKRKLYGQASGSIKGNQLSLLADRLDYTAIVLYKFKNARNRELDLFRWRYCYGKAITDVNRWLSKGHFAPRLTMTTVDVLRRLESETIGTTDEDIINSVIFPASARVMRIEIKWDEGQRPTARTHVLLKPRQEERIRIVRSS